jgi:DNA-directed RNA polymerase subunit RPC12/RpoP
MPSVRRILLILFNTTAILSLLLCIYAARLWIKNNPKRMTLAEQMAYLLKRRVPLYSPALPYRPQPKPSHHEFTINHGELYLAFYNNPKLDRFAPGPRLDWTYFAHPDLENFKYRPRLPPSAHSPVAGFYIGRIQHDSEPATLIVLPMYFIVTLLAALPLLATRQILRRHRARQAIAAGYCPQCNYDLRASTTRCPECGHPIFTKNPPPTPPPAEAYSPA